MKIMFNDLMHLSYEEIKNSKVEFNKTAGSGGERFIDLWYQHTEDERTEGICFDCSYWDWEKPGQIVFSFINCGEDTWLFVSAARIIEVRKEKSVKVEIVSECEKYFGRLLVHCRKRKKNYYVFCLSTYINDMDVVEIADSVEYLCRYKDDDGTYFHL